MKTGRCHYKDDHDRPISNAPKNIEVGPNVYLHRPSMTTSAAECLTTKWYSKLLSVKTGPFHALEVTSTIVTTDKDGIRRTASVDRATIAPSLKKTPPEDNKTKGDKTDDEREESHAVEKRLEEENVTNAARKYAMDPVERHLGKRNIVKIVLGWYGYRPADDTVEPPAHMSRDFITGY